MMKFKGIRYIISLRNYKSNMKLNFHKTLEWTLIYIALKNFNSLHFDWITI